MANIKSAKKRIIKSKKNQSKNISHKSMIRTLLKKVRIEIENGNKKSALKAFSKIQPVLDRHATKGLIHKNKSSRYKSNLIAKIKKLN